MSDDETDETIEHDDPALPATLDLISILEDARARVLAIDLSASDCTRSPCVDCAIARAVQRFFPEMDRHGFAVVQAIRAWVKRSAHCILSDREATVEDRYLTLSDAIKRAEMFR